MYKVNPDIGEPDRTLKIWHYYTLPKFLSFLHTGSLYLCRHDKIGDGYEGQLSTKDKAFLSKFTSGILQDVDSDKWGCSYSNCWTKSDVDEYVLWNSYSSLYDGVAIQSSIGNLIDSLDSSSLLDLYVSEVIYIDYDDDYTFRRSGGIANMIAPHFTKRKYFASEKEVRVMHYDPLAKFNESPCGLFAKVNSDVLISSVYVSPFSQPWFKEIVVELLGFYGLGHKTVNKSRI